MIGTNYKIFRVMAYYDKNHPADYLVRAYTKKQAKERFLSRISWLKIDEIEETSLTEEKIGDKDIVI